MKIPFFINAGMESLLEKIKTYLNNTKDSSTTEINCDVSFGYSLFTHCSWIQ